MAAALRTVAVALAALSAAAVAGGEPVSDEMLAHLPPGRQASLAECLGCRWIMGTVAKGRSNDEIIEACDELALSKDTYVGG
jgi:hypothetical protein